MTDSTRTRRADRAQTTIDYAVGVSLFLIALAFVVGFSGQLFVPFGGEASAPTADRLADELAGGTLGAPNDPAVIDPTCTAAFFAMFDTDTVPPAECRFGEGDTPAAVLGSTARVNVSIEHRSPGGGIVVVNTSEVAPSVDPDSVALSTPRSPPGGTSVTTARRVVLLDGRSVRLIVRVW